MGDTGPCGPSTEIHLDIRSDAAILAQASKQLVNTGHPQVIEIWNLVFIQYNRLASGQLEELSAKHVDTGLGLERLAMVLQGKESTYDTDIFAPLMQAIGRASGKTYGQSPAIDIAMRVIADHIRAVTFAIADGQAPSNTQAGYVVRRILRRAVRYGYTYLGFEEPFMYRLVEILVQQMGESYPAFPKQQAYIEQVIRSEEEAFLKTLAVGLQRLDQVNKALQEKGQHTIPGETAFELYDTYGFPLDLTCLIARDKGLQVDEPGFQQALQVQRTRSQQAAAVVQGDWQVVNKVAKPTFVGYDHLETSVKIVRYRTIQEKGKSIYQLVLDQTPFYAEGGGQIGDTGKLITAEEEIVILDTQKENELMIHYAQTLPKNLQATFHAVVDTERRQLIANNHSTTHLLHAALKQVLGPHVEQRGSLVNDQLLRFDFSHYAKLSPETIRQVEHIVNQKIRANIPLQEQRQVPLEAAKAMGATAHFGEKYGEYVRVVTFDPHFSRELCGGTHVPATGQLGLFKILTETAIAAGTRRIEAVTADAAENFIYNHLDTLDSLKEKLKTPKDLVKAVEQLIQEKSVLSKQVAHYQAEQVRNVLENLKQSIETIQGIAVLINKVELPHVEALKHIAFDLKAKYQSLFLVLGAVIEQKPHIAVLVSEDLITSKGLQANQLVGELAKPIQGGGGGQPFFATAGGKNIKGLEQALAMAQATFNRYFTD
jgi:alanyl-tRNA synthetase